jgi:hypothetical protein
MLPRGVPTGLPAMNYKDFVVIDDLFNNGNYIIPGSILFKKVEDLAVVVIRVVLKVVLRGAKLIDVSTAGKIMNKLNENPLQYKCRLKEIRKEDVKELMEDPKILHVKGNNFEVGDEIGDVEEDEKELESESEKVHVSLQLADSEAAH